MTKGTIVCMHALHWRVTVVGVGHAWWAGSYFILFYFYVIWMCG